MPMPMPHDGESHDGFMDRCMGDKPMNDEYPDSDQRYAVCESRWTKSEGAELKAATELLRAEVHGAPDSVDKQNNVIHGYRVAEEGRFKTDDRGEFDHKSLRQIVTLMKAEPVGTKVRLGHPTLSDDGIAKYLGRAKNPRIETIEEAGVAREVVKADLHIAKVAMDEPVGGGKPLGRYVMERADEDPTSFGSSLVLKTDYEQRLDSKGRPKLDDDGNELPPLWRPRSIHASDVVDTGDAVGAFLSAEAADRLPDAMVRQGCELLDRQFAGKDREFIRSHCERWLDRYLSWRFGSLEKPADAPVAEPPYDSHRDPAKLRIRHAKLKPCP